MGFAVVLVLLVIATVIFHFWSPWWFTPIASNWGMIDDTINLTFLITGIVFVLVNLFLAYTVYKFHHSRGQRAHYEPENKKLEVWLTVITTIGVVVLLAPGLWVWGKFVTVPDNAMEVEAVGQQWHWSFRLPGDDGVMGETDIRNVSLKNPFGLNPEDPNGQDDRLVNSNEVHLPLNQPVHMLLRSKDVLHDFAVAQFRVKMDLIPGMVTYLWFEPIRTGTFEILCEELCGMGHHTMRGKVVVDEPADFEIWRNSLPTFAETMAVPEGDPVAGQAGYAVCSACHGQQGEGNLAMNAPRLAGGDSWYMKRQLKYFQQGIRGAHEDDIYGQQMAPMAGMLPGDTAINDVLAYIKAMPEVDVEQTITGDVASGSRIFVTCANCHGQDGKGIWALNAPRLAGQSDWYLATQLYNYREGIRGAHPKDMYGFQMTLMADVVREEQAINDLLAYINTLD